MKALEDAIQTAKGNARVIGKLLREVCAASPRAAALVEQDLANPELSLEGCWKALKDYARKHQAGGFWGCAVFGADPENEVVKVVLDFYRIPPEWIGEGQTEPAEEAAPAPVLAPAGGAIDLMSLL